VAEIRVLEERADALAGTLKAQQVATRYMMAIE
jgi:hypothetical protein